MLGPNARCRREVLAIGIWETRLASRLGHGTAQGTDREPAKLPEP